jgi:hypothetical protein
LGGRGRRISEFEVSLVYKVSSRTARATQRNPVSKNKNKKQNKKKTTHTKKQNKTKQKDYDLDMLVHALDPALGRQRQVDFCVQDPHKVCSKPVRDTVVKVFQKTKMTLSPFTQLSYKNDVKQNSN